MAWRSAGDPFSLRPQDVPGFPQPLPGWRGKSCVSRWLSGFTATPSSLGHRMSRASHDRARDGVGRVVDRAGLLVSRRPLLAAAKAQGKARRAHADFQGRRTRMGSEEVGPGSHRRNDKLVWNRFLVRREHNRKAIILAQGLTPPALSRPGRGSPPSSSHTQGTRAGCPADIAPAMQGALPRVPASLGTRV